MQATIFFLLSVSVALSVSNPIAEPGQVLNEGDVIAVFDEDEPEQPAVLFVQQQQQPLDEFFVLESFNPDEQTKSKDTAEKDCEGCDNQQTETQARSFFFKKFFKPQIRPSVGMTLAIQKPQPIRLPSPIVVGTVYQPISFVTSPIATGGFAATGSSSQFIGNSMTGLTGYLQGLLNTKISAGQLSRPSIGLIQGTGAGVSGQQGFVSAAEARPVKVQVSRPPIGISSSSTAGLGNFGFNMLEQQHGLLQGLLTGGHSIGQMFRPSTGMSAGSSAGQGNVDVGMIGQQGLLPELFTGSRPTLLQESRPPAGLFPSSGGQGNVGINIQQSVLSSNSGPSSSNGAPSASVHVSSASSGHTQTQGGTTKPLIPSPTPWSEVNIDKVIDVMAQSVKS